MRSYLSRPNRCAIGGLDRLRAILGALPRSRFARTPKMLPRFVERSPHHGDGYSYQKKGPTTYLNRTAARWIRIG